MKKFGLLLMMLAVVALSVSTSQGALTSLYGFDNDYTNDVAGQPTGTPVTKAGGTGTLSFTAGMVGSGALLIDSDDEYLEMGARLEAKLPVQPIGDNLAQGSISFWINASATTVPWTNLINYSDTPAGASTGFAIWGSGTTQANSTLNMVVKKQQGTSYKQMRFGGGAGLWNTGTWKNVVITWKANDVNARSMYIDGVLATTTMASGGNAISTATTAATFATAVAYSNFGADGTYAAPGAKSFQGSFDDVAIFNTQLTQTQAKAIGSLALDALDYGAAEAQALFDLFAAGGESPVGGQTWEKVTSGLGTTAGAIVDLGGGIKGLNLGGADGAGVQIVPEPGTLTLLLAGAIGLLVFAWRKRK